MDTSVSTVIVGVGVMLLACWVIVHLSSVLSSERRDVSPPDFVAALLAVLIVLAAGATVGAVIEGLLVSTLVR